MVGAPLPYVDGGGSNARSTVDRLQFGGPPVWEIPLKPPRIREPDIIQVTVTETSCVRR